MTWWLWIYIVGAVITFGFVLSSLRGVDTTSYEPGDDILPYLLVVFLWPVALIGFVIWGFLHLTDRTIAKRARRSATKQRKRVVS